MDYGRLGKTEPTSSKSEPLPNQQDDATSLPKTTAKRYRIKLLLVFALAFLVASAVSVSVVVGIRARASGVSSGDRKPTVAISRTCSRTRYQSLCINSLLDFPGATSADEHDLVHISVNMTLRRVGRALSASSDINNLAMDLHVRSAYDDCLDLLDGSVDHLARSLIAVAEGNAQPTGSTEDVVTWLSAAMTNQDTCAEGLEEVSGSVKKQMEERLKDLSELVSNSLAIYAAASGDEDFVGIPTQNRRRLMSSARDQGQRRFPAWLGRRERALLEMPAAEVQADIVVAKDGSGTYTSIMEAIKKAPEHSDRRTIIYVKAGKYEEEDLKVGRKKTNLMFIGDGKGKTVITGGKSVADKITTFRTASFAATGNGFIARDMTFENSAGPSKHQAVALRIGADHAVVYRCEILGYQDTLYVHSQRQFYRECDIYGTVDFIFGNAAVVLQNCNIYSRKPMASQKNTITAQNRKDPNQNTGISIHACKILATPDLEASKGAVQTYLGRPWKKYSRTVYMLSSIGGHVDPRGWLEWNGDFALDTLYYGEYMNNGPGAGVSQRVKWPGYQVITLASEASKFTVAKFIYGSSWLPSTGVAFIAGLSV
ncbi:probable pectinesterase/pectinesterase inhibitor 61 [Rhododendron vialii]|uniref:probable pectinesterase/pectinesterase inhibitor 61 n=1 Tax=Rhododendron vialii TaxID=182163 RepID=UPI00265FAC98|nr:probable pectinesterase/pectinesterase inhibitor 61 [Rhododendron vialii]